MKEHIFSFIWAAICAWLTVWLLKWLNAELCLTEKFFFPAVVSFFHGHGLAVRKVLFWSLFLLYWFTGIHKEFGQWLFILIGWIVLIVIAILVVFFGYHFITWIAGTV